MADISSTSANPVRTRRPWFQFSLRTLLLAMLIFGCGLGWLVNKRSKSQAAWASLNTLWDDPPTAHDLIGTRSSRFERLLGIDLPDTAAITVENATSGESPDTPFENAHSLNGIYFSFHISGPDIYSQNLPTSYSVPTVYDWQFLHSCNITDETVRILSRLKVLGVLNLSHSNISDDALSHLQSMSSLVDLDLSHTEITGSGLLQLAQNKSLRKVNLIDTDIALKSVDKLRALRPDMTIVGP